MVQKARHCESSRSFAIFAVQDSRPPDRVQKLKGARSEAAKEVEAYKAKRDEEFKRFEAEVGCLSLVKESSLTSSYSYPSHIRTNLSRPCFCFCLPEMFTRLAFSVYPRGINLHTRSRRRAPFTAFQSDHFLPIHHRLHHQATTQRPGSGRHSEPRWGDQEDCGASRQVLTRRCTQT